MVKSLEEHDIYCCVGILPSDLENLWKGYANSQQTVPISAAGLQDEESLVDRLM
jgi:hypothetical protein